MSEQSMASLATSGDEIDAAWSACRQAVDGEFAEFGPTIPGAPETPVGWFELLHGIPEFGRQPDPLQPLKAAAQSDRPWPVGGIERYALLQAFQVALPRLAALPLDDALKRQFAAACRQVACPDKRWLASFDSTHPAYFQMTRVASLRWFPAGSLALEIINLPKSWLLKVHPFALPGLLREVAVGLGGFGPVVTPHLWSWRPNPMFVLKSETDQALWQIAKALERQPEVRGMIAVSWFYAKDVGEVFPHLAWLREFYVEQGAYLVEMELAEPDAGFLVGSAKRRRLYEEHKFRPRQTLVVWRRSDMLTWAAAHPELGQPHPPARTALRGNRTPEPPARGAGRGYRLASGKFTWINAIPQLNRHPKIYVLGTLAMPSAVAALWAASAIDRWAALPAFLLGLVLFWMLQYFFLQ
jgi:hypothetical protein